MTEREIAVRGLVEILENDSYGNVALGRIFSRHKDLGRLQKAFITEIISGCIRNLMQLDYIIDEFSKTQAAKMRPVILNILRASVYQMKFMDKVPVFAIVNEATDLTKKMGFGKLSGFVNGVLRNISRNPDKPALPDFEINPVEYLKIKYSCQQWIVEHFLKELGLQDTVLALESASKPPKITLCVNAKRITTAELREILTDEGLDIEESDLVKDCLIVSKTADISALESFKRGLYHVMDEAANLAAKCAMPSPNSRIIDLCAAPGGKSFAVAYMAEAESMIAGDIHSFKVGLINLGAKRLGLDIEARLWDATKLDKSLRATADLVIVDAPCSGLGTLRKRPDIKLRKSFTDVAALVSLQRQILSVAWEYLKPTGRLLYSTCTINNAENIDNLNWFLLNFPMKTVDFSNRVPNIPEFVTAKEGHVQILPQYFNTDGFFVAIFEKAGEIK